MQKTNRLALAVLALLGSTAVFAQSSVTLYGRVNTTVEQQKNGTAVVDGKVNGLRNNSSRIGFKGVEDLGGGLKAGFQLESGFGSDDGSGPMNFTRQSEVNLSGNFGMVRLGNFTPESYFATADYVSMHNHDTGSSSDALYYDPVWAPTGTAAVPNKIAYRTPSFGGVTVEGAVSLGEKTANNKNGVDLAANYNLGALALGAGYSQLDSNKQFGLRALYTFGQFTVGGYYQRNDDANQLRVGGAGTRNNFRLSGMYALGASEFHLNVGRANSWSKRSDTAATQYTIAYNYNLSKRTKVYTYYTRVNKDAGAAALYTANKNDFSSIAVGVRHNF